MIAAIYARKSTEQRGVSEETRSVTRQVDHATAYAKEKGWTVNPEYIMIDDGISGAEFVKRPGLIRLLNALHPRPPFDVLIMSEESRLGREQIETSYVLKQILDAGVKVFFYLDNRERKLETAMDKLLLSLVNFASEMEREKARQRTYDALLRKAKAKQVVGGLVYGYDNIDVKSDAPGPDGKYKRAHVVRRINENEASIVRRIFQMCADGKGLTRIAKSLNAEAVTPPRMKHNGWAPTAIREMLYRPLYRGLIVWNKSQKVNRGGTKKRRRRPENEWISIPAPELRIVSEDLWEKAHARLEQTRNAYARGSKSGHLLGRPTRSDLESPYLLSGFGRCTVCNGPIISMTRGHGKRRARFYGCSYNHKRGSAICSNGIQIKQDVLDHAILEAIAEILDERTVEAAVEIALERLRTGQERHLDRRTAIERELSLIDARERHLTAAIARGDDMDPLLASLKAEGTRKKALVRELEGLADVEKVASLDAHRIKRHLKSRVSDAKDLMTGKVPQVRQMIRKLLVDRLEFTPVVEKGEKGYRFTGEGSFGQFLSGESCATNDGVPNGI